MKGYFLDQLANHHLLPGMDLVHPPHLKGGLTRWFMLRCQHRGALAGTDAGIPGLRRHAVQQNAGGIPSLCFPFFKGNSGAPEADVPISTFRCCCLVYETPLATTLVRPNIRPVASTGTLVPWQPILRHLKEVGWIGAGCAFPTSLLLRLGLNRKKESGQPKTGALGKAWIMLASCQGLSLGFPPRLCCVLG